MTTLQDAPPATSPAPEPPAPAPARAKVRSPLPVAAGVTVWIALALTGLIAWTALYTLAVSALEEHHDQARLYAQLRQELSAATAPLGGAITPGHPVALMTMRSAGLHDVVVVEGTAAGDLESGPGHRRNSPLPGQAGVAIIYGRATFFGGPFGDIASAAAGDPITITTGQGVAKYRVIDVRRAGDPYPPALAAGAGRLMLVTADASGWRSGWASNHAVYVDAELVGRPFPSPGGRPASVPKSELALRGDPGALYSLVFWLPLLGGLAVLVVWMRQRWGGWQTWLVAVPVLLAALWGVTESAVRLLPNLL